MNLKENWGLKIDIGIYKDLSKFPNNHARKILEAIENFASNPYVGDIRKIKNEKNLWRKRVGNYRIFYEMHKDKKFIHALWVERRTSKTY